MTDSTPGILYARALLTAAGLDVPVVWLEAAMCVDGVCRASVGDILMYRDQGHLSMKGSRYLWIA